jgi:hypothetical protein
MHAADQPHVPLQSTGSAPSSRVVFCRGRHRWSFECDGPGEPELLRWVAWCAEHPGYAIDRFDAAVIARQFVVQKAGAALNPQAREAD